jgi:hypothetical protein
MCPHPLPAKATRPEDRKQHLAQNPQHGLELKNGSSNRSAERNRHEPNSSMHALESQHAQGRSGRVAAQPLQCSSWKCCLRLQQRGWHDA